MVNYDDQVRREIKRLGPAMAKLTIGNTGEGTGNGDPPASSSVDVVAEVVVENAEQETASIAAAPTWDVFKSRRRSSVLVFQNSQME